MPTPSFRPSDRACSHCGLPVPTALLEPESATQFCCNGCRQVYALIRDADLDGYYEYRSRLEAPVEPPRVSGQEYSEYDDEAFQRLHVRRLVGSSDEAATDGASSEVDLELEGVHCAACVWLVERLPRLCPGVSDARLDFARSVVRLTYEDREVALSEVARTLDRLGYPSRPMRGKAARERHRAELRRLLIRVGVAGASAGNVMLLAFSLYSDLFGDMSHEARRLIEIASLVISLPALWAGSVFFRGAWASLRARAPHMDLPIAIGILAAFFWGTHHVVVGEGEIYFDSVTALIFLLLVGRYLGRRHQVGESEAAELLHAVAPASADVVAAGNVERRSVDDIEPGEVVRVRSGEVVPVDGVVLGGVSTLDRSVLSGESRPVAVAQHDLVEAGAVNWGGELTIRVEKSGRERRVARLVEAVERALHRRARLVGQADRIAGIFTLTVLVLALVTLIAWWQVDPEQGIDHALALLIVACPCALGLATPLAVSAAVGAAARAGILLKGGDTIERLAQTSLVVFDKTGTLTEGRLTLLRYVGDTSLAAAVRAVESQSSHPVARALVEGLSVHDDGRVPVVTDLREELGRGVQARVSDRDVAVGSINYMTELGCKLDEFEGEIARGARSGETPVAIAVDGQLRAVAFLADPVRADAAASLLELRRSGHRLALLSGDHPDVVRATARELVESAGGSELFDFVEGAVTPETKLSRIDAWVRQRGGSGVVMVGDGVNDAGALAAANVGVAVRSAAEASLLSADVFLSRDGVRPVVDLLSGAGRTLSIIRRGIAFSLLYNVVGVSLAVSGVLEPLMAAVLMPISSATVVVNAYRSRSFVLRRASDSDASSEPANENPLPTLHDTTPLEKLAKDASVSDGDAAQHQGAPA